MMKKIPLIQYLPLTRPKAAKLFLKKLTKAKVMSILDLEDSAQDPFSKSRTGKLKISARHGLELISKDSNISCSSNVYIRINSSDSEFYNDDVESVISAYANGMKITGVFLPKVESYSQVENLIRKLSIVNEKVELVAMIETVEGLNNLEEMLKLDTNNNFISRVHYGHFDYCLDAKIWPFLDPIHRDFWSVVEKVVKPVLRSNKTYIHTPFPFTRNEKLFWESSFHLKNLYPFSDIWICTLNSELSLSSQPKKVSELDISSPNFSESFLINEAKKICKNFLEGRANKRSFSVSDERFIPPHQYFAAKHYLDKT